jgi:hypothetical protein
MVIGIDRGSHGEDEWEFESYEWDVYADVEGSTAGVERVTRSSVDLPEAERITPRSSGPRMEHGSIKDPQRCPGPARSDPTIDPAGLSSVFHPF